MPPRVGRFSPRPTVWGQSMQDGLSAPVIGPSAILPRGYWCLAPVWYLIVGGALALSRWPPLWFRLTAAAGLLLAMIVFVLVLNSITTHAFTATQEGVDLGLPVFSRRRGRQRRGLRHLPWRHIERGMLPPRADGSPAGLILNPNTTPSPRGFQPRPPPHPQAPTLLLASVPEPGSRRLPYRPALSRGRHRRGLSLPARPRGSRRSRAGGRGRLRLGAR